MQLVFAIGGGHDIPVAPGALGHGHFCVQAGLEECLPGPAVWWVFPGV